MNIEGNVYYKYWAKYVLSTLEGIVIKNISWNGYDEYWWEWVILIL